MSGLWNFVPTSWRQAGAPDYQLQVSRGRNFDKLSNLVIDEDVTDGTTFTVPNSDALVTNRTYYWRVRGIGRFFEPGVWSEVRSFRIAPPADLQ